MTDYPTREYIIRETTYPDATKQEAIGELVRCRDCKWFEDANDDCGTCGFFEDARSANHFCGEGERKDGDHHEG